MHLERLALIRPACEKAENTERLRLRQTACTRNEIGTYSSHRQPMLSGRSWPWPWTVPNRSRAKRSGTGSLRLEHCSCRNRMPAWHLVPGDRLSVRPGMLFSHRSARRSPGQPRLLAAVQLRVHTCDDEMSPRVLMAPKSNRTSDSDPEGFGALGFGRGDASRDTPRVTPRVTHTAECTPAFPRVTQRHRLALESDRCAQLALLSWAASWTSRADGQLLALSSAVAPRDVGE